MNEYRKSSQYWAEDVKYMYDYKCVLCGKEQGNTYWDRLEAHHIYPASEYPEYARTIENGIALCRTCHARLHFHISCIKGKPEENKERENLIETASKARKHQPKCITKGKNTN